MSVRLTCSCGKSSGERRRPSNSADPNFFFLNDSRHSPSVLEPTGLRGLPFVFTSHSHRLDSLTSPGFLPSLLVVNVPQDGGWSHSISPISTPAWMRQMRDFKMLLQLCKAVNGFAPRYIQPLYYQALRAFRSSGTSLPPCPQSQN